MVVVRANNDAAALADELPGGAGASLQAFFDHAGLEAAAGGGADGEEEELEWLSNKDAFPSLETMAAGAVAAPARAAVGPRTKGVRRRRRVMAWNFPLALPQPPEAAAQPRRRCRHCEAEETPQWRAGPEGPRTLCNACGVRYKTGRLVPEYRPANSPTFSPEMHSNSHRRILEMRRRKEAASATGGTARSRRAARNAGEK